MSEISIPQETVPTFASPQGFPEKSAELLGQRQSLQTITRALKID